METKNLWLYVDPNDGTAAYDCVGDLCMMVVKLTPPLGFTLSFDPNIQLLVEQNKVNYMQEGKGTPMVDFELYDGDMPAVIERNGKQYRVRLMTWDRSTPGRIGLFFEIEIDDIPSPPTGAPSAP
jgi:hypothetical protein